MQQVPTCLLGLNTQVSTLKFSTMGSGLTPGVDFGAYPKSRKSFVFGINLAF